MGSVLWGLYANLFEAVVPFFKGGFLPKAFTSTTIVLIPEIKDAVDSSNLGLLVSIELIIKFSLR